MGIITKSTIEQWILPNLSIEKRGFKTKVPLSEVVELIFYRLKTGCHRVAGAMARITHETVCLPREIKNQTSNASRRISNDERIGQ